MEYKISIIIRTYNEEKRIRDVLEGIKKQNYKNYEVIIVDSESTDNTLKICKEYDTRIVNIKKKDFNYSYASNVGAEYASGEILCYLSGHSVPVRKDYLKIANEIFNSEKVGGVYGEVIALPDGSFIEKLFNWIGWKKSEKVGTVVEKEIHPGILSCSNALIRKDIWKSNRFKEELGIGGEDVEMAYRIMKENMTIIKEPRLLVMHSHGNGIVKFTREFLGWRDMYKDVMVYINNNP